MKITTKAASVFAAVVLSASFGIAQRAPVPERQSPAVVSNNIELVIEGKVIDVHDGDTVTVLDQNNQKFHIRLHGIDAPELKQEFGLVSQKNLARLVLGKQVSIFWTKVDRYRRTVGTIKIDGRDINIEQVKAGMAWHFKKYQDEQEPQDRITYAAAEEQARAARLGLWQDPNPMVPGDWRQDVKAKRWGPPPPPGTIIGNSNSKKYHRPDCAGYRDMAERNRVFFKSVAEAEAAGYKRAGNCPAEIQVSTSNLPAVSTASPAVITSSPATAVSSVAPVTAPTTNIIAPEPTATIAADPIGAPAVAPESTEAQPVSSPSNGAASGVAAAKIIGKVIGNKNSKKYHLPGCSSYRLVSEKNQVKFDTALEAEQAGYKLAGTCSANKSNPGKP